MIKFKIIKNHLGEWFLIRLSFNLKKGSIKLHFILRDDIDKPHSHPWDFKSFLLIPYKEVLYTEWVGRKEYFRYDLKKHKMFKLVERKSNTLHKTLLYTIFGINIPAITIGRYYEKKQLCSFCKELGYCKENKH